MLIWQGLKNLDQLEVTKRVNGRATGLTGRTNYYNRAIGVLK